MGDKEPEGMHPGQRLLGLISDAAYYMNDFISRLAAIYQSEQKLRQGDEKLRQSARQQAFKEAEAREKLELARLQAEQRGKEIEYRIGADARAARVIAAAIRMREREELDDIGVAEYIERQGVSVPAILAARAAKAITLLEPPVSDVNDVDDEQLDKEAREFATLQANHPQWLAERRADVATIVEELGCGDYDRNGERKAGEFEANDEELDIDPSATAEIYGDYDASDVGYDAGDDDIAIEPPEDD
uniref:DNA pacase A subunit n=1 Tax=Escherichia coli TaxID=562 RepID=UPI00202DEEEB|nr:DNA pacase A subunit [Escherichia coli]